jgi:hypothetical protein
MIEVLEMERRWSGARKVRSKSGQGVAFPVAVEAFAALPVSIGSDKAEWGGRGRNGAERSATGLNRAQRVVMGPNGRQGAGTALNVAVSGGPRRVFRMERWGWRGRGGSAVERRARWPAGAARRLSSRYEVGGARNGDSRGWSPVEYVWRLSV